MGNAINVASWTTSISVSSSRTNGLYVNEHTRMYIGEIIQLSGSAATQTRTDIKTSAAQFIETAVQKARVDVALFNCGLSALV